MDALSATGCLFDGHADRDLRRVLFWAADVRWTDIATIWATGQAVTAVQISHYRRLGRDDLGRRTETIFIGGTILAFGLALLT